MASLRDWSGTSTVQSFPLLAQNAREKWGTPGVVVQAKSRFLDSPSLRFGSLEMTRVV